MCSGPEHETVGTEGKQSFFFFLNDECHGSALRIVGPYI